MGYIYGKRIDTFFGRTGSSIKHCCTCKQRTRTGTLCEVYKETFREREQSAQRTKDKEGGRTKFGKRYAWMRAGAEVRKENGRPSSLVVSKEDVNLETWNKDKEFRPFRNTLRACGLITHKFEKINMMIGYVAYVAMVKEWCAPKKSNLALFGTHTHTIPSLAHTWLHTKNKIKLIAVMKVH
ncbi:hypothetical protein PsorP6_015327 [Peronosclerospora sorghi]|uniref:Uncharacterized protein n=1 Tax=Peronosclerospora sorghi TaxID=230839 RepID=A0ACC0VTY3_9STRA|nr:hypothetical protein PsorP6_015327 [Peronosclerospora sorghi]